MIIFVPEKEQYDSSTGNSMPPMHRDRFTTTSFECIKSMPPDAPSSVASSAIFRFTARTGTAGGSLSTRHHQSSAAAGQSAGVSVNEIISNEIRVIPVNNSYLCTKIRL
ncbi:MAG: hypothetical protein LBE79_01935 [Tannerella sp.]|nr:hypothetical protein [Tannerella sp.]